ncbi:MAG: GNAT family N-acetyltransferase [Bacteroidales bacterium]|nr:GNAT family N-acetyltransferase [Bacteroidales bacterium]
MIREMLPGASNRILEIFQMGVETRNATFETSVPSWSEWDSKHLRHSRFVYTEGDQILGWIALSPFSARKAYEGVAEISVYIDTESLGKGIGTELMNAVIASSEQEGVWTLYSHVFPENIATLRLHTKFGFRIIGIRESIAQLDGQWRDTVLLERRSKKTGV